jgi:hypothetical protein
MKFPAALAFALLLAGCASYSGYGLQAGSSRAADVERTMGPPALRWTDPDGSQQLAYPRGPSGLHTIMVRIDPQGVMTSRENVLSPKHLAKVREGMSQEDVLRTLGPSDPFGTVYFAARDELVWDWRWCDDYGEPSRFYVLFDASKGTVRTTMNQSESMAFGLRSREWCNRRVVGLDSD